MAINKLTATQVKAAEYSGRAKKIFDGAGLYLHVQRSGKYWRLKYRYAGKEKLLALGVYPEISLKKARERRNEARELLVDGIDPAAYRRSRKFAKTRDSANNFKKIASEWYKSKKSGWTNTHAKRLWNRLERHVFPDLGAQPINEIDAADVFKVLKKIESRGTIETAYRVRVIVGQVFRYAIVTSRAKQDPTPALRDALAPASHRHFPAVTDPNRVGDILRMIDSYSASPVVGAALRLAPLVFVRPGDLRTMKWSQVDFKHAEWHFTVSKSADEHIVPLSRQAIEILKSLQPLTDHSDYVFPGLRSSKRPISDMTLGAALRRLGIDTRSEHTTHGWRATARTLLHERLGYAPEVIEHQLAHKVPDILGAAYNRTRFIDQRKNMMQEWADYLDLLRDSRNHPITTSD